MIFLHIVNFGICAVTAVLIPLFFRPYINASYMTDYPSRGRAIAGAIGGCMATFFALLFSTTVTQDSAPSFLAFSYLMVFVCVVNFLVSAVLHKREGDSSREERLMKLYEDRLVEKITKKVLDSI
jgi:nitrate/nitrite transporter NarK